MRFKRRLEPAAPPLRLGNPTLDGLAVREPDLAQYDERYARPTKDPDPDNAENFTDDTGGDEP